GCGSQRQCGSVKLAPGFEQQVTSFEVETSATDMAAFGRGFQRLDCGSSCAGVLLKQNRIGPVRHRRAGEDPHRLPSADGARITRSCGRFAYKAKACGEGGYVGSPNRVAIHCGGVEGRLRSPSVKVFGEHTASSVGDINILA